MPGWDIYSFGYHGDDGLFFSETSGGGVELNEPFGKLGRLTCTPELSQLNQDFFFLYLGGSIFIPGAGDTVGCGLIYPVSHKKKGYLFFTKNGRLVRRFPLSYHYFYIKWFPVIG